jgi:hypothetical protein
LSRSTSADGIASYDDNQQVNLHDVFQHCAFNLAEFAGGSSPNSPIFDVSPSRTVDLFAP